MYVIYTRRGRSRDWQGDMSGRQLLVHSTVGSEKLTVVYFILWVRSYNIVWNPKQGDEEGGRAYTLCMCQQLNLSTIRLHGIKH